MAATRLVICGSPAHGRCERAAREACEQLERRYPEDRVGYVNVAVAKVHGCTGCNRCRETGACFMRDDMDRVSAALDASCELFVVSPVYFAGPPSQMKALLDRLQPYYWKWLAHRRPGAPKQPKRPARLLAVGEGGDPNGFQPLVASVRSALAVAGFVLMDVQAVIGAAPEGLVDAVPTWLGLSGEEGQRFEETQEGAGI